MYAEYSMDAIIQAIRDKCSEEGFPICTHTEDGGDETGFFYEWKEASETHLFIGKNWNWSLSSISKSGKTVKGKKVKCWSTITKEFSRMNVKFIIEDCVNRRRLIHEHNQRDYPV